MIKRQEQTLFWVYAAAFFAMLFWGCSFIWSTIVFKYWDPITTIFLRLVCSTIILFTILICTKKRDKIDRKDYKTFFCVALFNPFLYFIGESYGLKYSSPTISAAIIATIPIFTVTFASIRLKERILPINILGMLISFLGIGLIIFGKGLYFSTKWYGVTLLFCAVFASMFYSVFIRKLSLKYNAFTIIAWQDLIGSVLFLPLFVGIGWKNFVNTKITSELVNSFSMLTIFASILAFAFYTFTIKKLGVSRASVFTNFIPVVTAIVSYLILKEEIGTNKIVGILTVTGGVFMSQIGKINNK